MLHHAHHSDGVVVNFTLSYFFLSSTSVHISCLEKCTSKRKTLHDRLISKLLYTLYFTRTEQTNATKKRKNYNRSYTPPPPQITSNFSKLNFLIRFCFVSHSNTQQNWLHCHALCLYIFIIILFLPFQSKHAHIRTCVCVQHMRNIFRTSYRQGIVISLRTHIYTSLNRALQQGKKEKNETAGRL